MDHPVVREDAPAIVKTRVWREEHDWLYGLFTSPRNTAPKFRFPDLLGACVSLVVALPEGSERLVEFLVTELARRDASAVRRSCDIWAAQFDQLKAAHGAAWNRFPNPQFDLDQVATACVAVAMSAPLGPDAVLGQARLNWLARTTTRASRGGTN